MFVELHLIQNFAPSCLNRDDTNSPKECTFGGVRRARISSQCLKRSTRTHPLFKETVAGRCGTRTKRVAAEVAKALVELGKDTSEAMLAAEAALVLMGFKVENGNTAVLLYLAPSEVSLLAKIVAENFEALLDAVDPKSQNVKEGKKRTTKVKSKHKVPKEAVKVLKELRCAPDAADVALFGRMVAENRSLEVDASCQVAHALSTHRVDTEMDFYTAVDDLSPADEAGAGMMGVVEFNSACFYRYAVVDLEQLAENLGGDRELARDSVLAFARAMVAAIPTGKQNSMAAHSPPSYVRVKVKDGIPWSLANAFLKPVQVRANGEDLGEKSIDRLREHHARLTEMYGGDGTKVDLEASLYPKHEGIPLPKLWEELEGALA